MNPFSSMTGLVSGCYVFTVILEKGFIRVQVGSNEIVFKF